MVMKLYQWTEIQEKQLYVILTKLAGAMAKGNTPLRVVTNRILPHINRGSPIIILSPLKTTRQLLTLLETSGLETSMSPYFLHLALNLSSMQEDWTAQDTKY